MLEEKLKHLPERPGVYLMKDDQGRIIYVGKALSLKNRVRSYFHSPQQHTPKVRALVEHISDFEYIVTDNELEALILECNLIKKHRPKYNVYFKDDKTYPYIKVTVDEEFPRVMMTRRMVKDGSRYFGPYTDVGAVHETLNLLREIFPLRTCKKKEPDYRSRPCLNAHIKKCLAPCAKRVDRETYGSMIREVLLFLEGRGDDLILQLKDKMNRAAESLDFETAAKVRDQIQAIQKVIEKQKVVSTDLVDQDVVAIAKDETEACVQVFFIRKGKLIGREAFFLKDTAEEKEILTAFIKQYYLNADFIPKEILLQHDIDEMDLISSWLEQKRGSKVYLKIPRRGAKQTLVEMAAKNGSLLLAERRALACKEQELADRTLEELQQHLGLEQLPRRIECFDISNTQGSESVASMVVFHDGKPLNRAYRRFRIQGVSGPDDFASMKEVIERRFNRGLEEQQAVARGELALEEAKFLPFPDLLIVDGGKGQLGSAREVMISLGVGNIPTFGLAKQFEYLFRPGRTEPIILPANSQALYLLQRVRDEAHRFAVTYHRRLRDEGRLMSVLEEIPGIGKSRRRALLLHFKNLEELKKAEVDELAGVPGMNRSAAENVYSFFRNEQ